MPRRLKIFIASPGDVAAERRIARELVSDIARRFDGKLEISTFDWESTAFGSSKSFSKQIGDLRDQDLVIATFWSRLGTPDSALPSMDLSLKQLIRDGERVEKGEVFPSCSAFEVLSAIDQELKTGKPTVLTLRRIDTPPRRSMIGDEVAAVQETRQWQNVQNFFNRWYHRPDGSIRRAYRIYGDSGSPPLVEYRAMLRELLEDWMRRQPGFGKIALKDGLSPFRGLDRFEFRDNEIYFGRKRKIDRCVDLLNELASINQDTASTDHANSQDRRRLPFLLISGVSGSGKSSLMRAGVAPRIVGPSEEMREESGWRIAAMRPATGNGDVFDTLANALLCKCSSDTDPDQLGIALPELTRPFVANASDTVPVKNAKELAEKLRHAEVGAIHTCLAALTAARSDRPTRLLLLIDQFEELFTSTSEDARTRFSECLFELAGSRVWIIATLRADFYPQMISSRLIRLKDAGANYDLAPPSVDEVQEILEDSALAAGFDYENVPGISSDAPLEEIVKKSSAASASLDPSTVAKLDRRLILDTRQRDVLPLLQFTLQNMYSQMRASDTPSVMRFVHYSTVGGLDGAIGAAAEKAFHSVDTMAQHTLPALLRGLVNIAVGDAQPVLTQSFRYAMRRAHYHNLAPTNAAQRMLNALVEQRIVRVFSNEGVRVAQLSHERVIPAWQRASDLLAQSEELLKDRAAIEGMMQTWSDRGQDPEYLLPRGQLVAAARNLQAAEDLPKALNRYIDRSIRHAYRQRRRIRIGISAVMVALIGMLMVAIERSRTSNESFNIALSSVDGLTERLAIETEETDGFEPEVKEIILDRIDDLIDDLDARSSTTNTVSPSRVFRALEAILFDTIRSVKPDSASDQIARLRGTSAFAWGKTFREKRSYERADTFIKESLVLREKLFDENPDEIWAISDLADSLELFGDNTRSLRRQADALPSYERALKLRQSLLANHPGHRLYTIWLKGEAELFARFGDTYGSLGNAEQSRALQHYTTAAKKAHFALRSHSTDIVLLNENGWTTRKLAEHLARQPDATSEDLRVSIELLSTSVCLREELLARRQTNVTFRQDLGWTLMSLARVHERNQDARAALIARQRAFFHRREAHSGMSSNIELASDLLDSHLALVEMHSVGDLENKLAVAHAYWADDLIITYPTLVQDGSDRARSVDASINFALQTINSTHSTLNVQTLHSEAARSVRHIYQGALDELWNQLLRRENAMRNRLVGQRDCFAVTGQVLEGLK